MARFTAPVLVRQALHSNFYFGKPVEITSFGETTGGLGGAVARAESLITVFGGRAFSAGR